MVEDRDEDDCLELKQRMEAIAARVGLRSKTRAGAWTWQLVNRIAVEELEAWYFGDWEGMRQAYPRVTATTPRRRGFRDPDAPSYSAPVHHVGGVAPRPAQGPAAAMR